MQKTILVVIYKNFLVYDSSAMIIKMHHRYFSYTKVFITTLALTVATLAIYTYERGISSYVVIPESSGEVVATSSRLITQSTPPPAVLQVSVCDAKTIFSDESDRRWCSMLPLADQMRLFQIDLTHEKILFFQHGILQKIFPLAYQAPYGKWFQTPTGFFEVGVKREKFMSSIFPVWMEHAVQIYEDFFIHGIPYHTDGTKVTSQFSGGCIRLEDPVAADFYDTAQKGDMIVSYLSLADAQIKNNMIPPVDTNSFWIRQRFNSPLKTDWSWHEDKQYNYIQHTGVDFAPYENAKDISVRAIASGTVELVVYNGIDDGGLGNTIIISHNIEGKKLYALYGHMESMELLKKGDMVDAGEKIGVVGNTGYGCNYWHVGTDGCDATGDPDIHLHFEIKDKPILASPIPDTCILPSGKKTQCIGYTSHNPTDFGYRDPLLILFSSGVLPASAQASIE